MLDNLFDVPPVGGINLYPSVGAALLPYKCPGVVEHLLLAVGEKDLMFDNLSDVPLVGETNLYPLSGAVLFPYRRPEVAEHLFLAVGNNLIDVPSVAGTNLVLFVLFVLVLVLVLFVLFVLVLVLVLFVLFVLVLFVAEATLVLFVAEATLKPLFGTVLLPYYHP